MSQSVHRSLVCLTALVAMLAVVPAESHAQDARTIAAAERVRDAALADNIALDYVTQLTTRFGPRPAGSPSETAAAEWAADYMREHGFQNVRIQTFPLIGWERGIESASIVGANPQPLVVAALGSVDSCLIHMTMAASVMMAR